MDLFILTIELVGLALILKKAGLIKSVGRGRFVITQEGLNTLKEKPSCIDRYYLKKFPSFWKSSQNKTENLDEGNTRNEQTPEESLDSVYQDIQQTLAQELLNRVIELSPMFFERLGCRVFG